MHVIPTGYRADLARSKAARNGDRSEELCDRGSVVVRIAE